MFYNFMANKLIKGVDNGLWNKLKALGLMNGRSLASELNIAIDSHIKKEFKNIKIENESENI